MVPKFEITVPLTGHKNLVLRYFETGVVFVVVVVFFFAVEVFAEVLVLFFQLQRLGEGFGAAAC